MVKGEVCGNHDSGEMRVKAKKIEKPPLMTSFSQTETPV